MTPLLFGYVMFFAAITPIIPIGVIIYRRKSTPQFILKILLVMLIFNLCIEAVSYVSLSIWENNDLVFDIHSLIWGVLLIELYRYELSNNWVKKVLRFILILHVTYSVINASTTYYLGVHLVDPYLILSLLMIALSVYYFHSVFSALEIENITHHYFFWINSAMLVFFGSTIFITLFESFIDAFDSEMYIVVWPVQLFATALFNVILAKGIWVTKQI